MTELTIDAIKTSHAIVQQYHLTYDEKSLYHEHSHDETTQNDNAKFIWK